MRNRKSKLVPGLLVILNMPGHTFHGQLFEVVRYNGRHCFVIVRVTKRFGDYRKGDELRLAGSLLDAVS